MQIGITLSHPHLEYLGIQTAGALSYALSMGFSHIRLGSYWNRVEKSKNIYDFGELERILEACEAASQPIIMNVGMKSPRWPEFYIPSYIKNRELGGDEIRERVLLFIETTIAKLKQYSCITHWQIENEPLDESGPENRTIPPTLLQEECDLVRSLDNRPIIISLWGNELIKRNLVRNIEPLADSIGIDIYYRQYMGERFGRSTYSGPQSTDETLKHYILSSHKPIIITELQGEPWEKDEKGYLSDNQNSISPKLLSSNIQRAINLGVREILLWGYEYWYLQMMKGDDSYMKVVKELCYRRPNVGALAAGEGDR